MFSKFRNVFGYRFGKHRSKETTTPVALPLNQDAAVQLISGSVLPNSYILNKDASPVTVVQNEIQLINKYRDMALNTYCSAAIDEIVNEAIVCNNAEPPVTIAFDEDTAGFTLSENLRDSIKKEFKTILRLLDFSNQAYDLFKQHYVDGKLVYQTLIDVDNPESGIQELVYIDPRCIKKLQNFQKSRDPQTGIEIIDDVEEVFIYNPNGLTGLDVSSTTGIKISPESIIFAHSGIRDVNNTQVLSHLYKAIRPFNQLVQVEDFMLIYRFTRSTEKLVFNIDTNNLPPQMAEAHVKQMMTDYKNKLTYNSKTGEIQDDRRFATVTENYWFAKRSDGRGSEVTTLNSSSSFNEIDDIIYFQKTLYKALNVPVSRLDPDKTQGIGRGADITREEVKFGKFINRLRARFSILFDELLKRQLILKKKTTEQDWEYIKQAIYYDFVTDSHFSELKKLEIWKERFDIADAAKNFVEEGYVDKDFIKTEILNFSQEEIEQAQEDAQENINNNEDSTEEMPEGEPQDTPIEPENPDAAIEPNQNPNKPKGGNL